MGNVKMFNFNNTNEIIDTYNVVNENEFVFKGKLYKLTRINENVQRGEFDNLTAYDFRNNEENHNITLYVEDSLIQYVETGL